MTPPLNVKLDEFVYDAEKADLIYNRTTSQHVTQFIHSADAVIFAAEAAAVAQTLWWTQHENRDEEESNIFSNTLGPRHLLSGEYVVVDSDDHRLGLHNTQL